jgi:hypothetical protein
LEKHFYLFLHFQLLLPPSYLLLGVILFQKANHTWE